MIYFLFLSPIRDNETDSFLSFLLLLLWVAFVVNVLGLGFLCGGREAVIFFIASTHFCPQTRT